MKRFLCWFLALLLTGFLVLFGISYAVSQVVEPGTREGGAVASDSIQKMELALIQKKIEELAPIYGFSAETAMKYVTPEAVGEMNRQTAVWWNSILVNGEATDAPAFGTDEMAAAFLKDAAPAGGEEGETDEAAELRATEAANAVGESILRIILPLRLPIVGKGLTEAAARVDLGNVIRFLLGIRWAALAMCALLAGLIALLESRKLRESLKYIGSAMGAAVLVLAACCVLYVLSGVDPLIAGASMSLSLQYGSLLNGAAVRLFIYAGVLLAGCVICLILYRRQYEAKAD